MGMGCVSLNLQNLFFRHEEFGRDTEAARGWWWANCANREVCKYSGYFYRDIPDVDLRKYAVVLLFDAR